MTFEKTVTLKDGRNCLLRNGVTSDGKAVLDVFNRTHEETDYLLTYSDEKDRKSTRLNSSHITPSRMPSSA